MRRNAINQYKNVKVKTASPGEVLVMLYDGLFRFLHEAHTAMSDDDCARAGERLDRAHAIVSELLSTLRPEVAPELCQQLSGVYHFCMDHIIQANIEQKAELINEVIKVLTPIRDGFRQAVTMSVAADHDKLEAVGT